MADYTSRNITIVLIKRYVTGAYDTFTVGENVYKGCGYDYPKSAALKRVMCTVY